jgi:3-oxoacid CoA-transferase
VPQGTLAERLRAHAAGIPAIFTPTGASTAVEKGTIPVRYHEGGLSQGVKIPGISKEHREFNGRRYVLEHAIPGDVAFVRAWKVDEVGNTVFRFGLPQSLAIVCSMKLSAGIRRTTSTPSWRKMRS